jgi:hypothetical protein
MNGWGKINSAASYAGVKPRTLRSWLKQGLRHSRLPSGTVLIKFSEVDDFLKSFSSDENEIDKIVNEAVQGLVK